MNCSDILLLFECTAWVRFSRLSVLCTLFAWQWLAQRTLFCSVFTSKKSDAEVRSILDVSLRKRAQKLFNDWLWQVLELALLDVFDAYKFLRCIAWRERLSQANSVQTILIAFEIRLIWYTLRCWSLACLSFACLSLACLALACLSLASLIFASLALACLAFGYRRRRRQFFIAKFGLIGRSFLWLSAAHSVSSNSLVSCPKRSIEEPKLELIIVTALKVKDILCAPTD